MTFLFSNTNRTKVIEAAIERRRRKQAEAEKQIQDEVLQKPILYLAKNRDYDEILFVLINKAVNVQDWIDVGGRNESYTVTSLSSKRCSDSTCSTSVAQTRSGTSVSHGLESTTTTSNVIAASAQQMKQDSVLHLILKYEPPVEIIDLLIERMNECNCFTNDDNDNIDRTGSGTTSTITPEVIIDTQGRTPLHIAVSIGSPYDIVLRLVGRGTHQDISTCPAFIKDSMDRYALHWACTNPSKVEVTKSCFNIGTRVKSKTIDNYNILKVVQLLVQINPKSVLHKDVNGETPIDIAKKHLVKDDIVRLLEKVVVWVEDNATKMKEKVKSSKSRKTQSKFDSSFGTLTSRTSATTNTTTNVDVSRAGCSSSSPSSSSSPLLQYNNTRVGVTMRLSDFLESTKEESCPDLIGQQQQQQHLDDRVATITNNKRNPPVPLEIFQNIELVSDNYRKTNATKDYVGIEDDVSSVGSGGISTLVQRRPKILTQI